MKRELSFFHCLALTGGALLLVGCDQKNLSPLHQQIGALETRVQQLESNNSNLVIYAYSLENQLSDLHSNIWKLQSGSAGSFTTVDLSSTSGFVPVTGRCGVFLISVKNVEPYLDGFRVRFEIGNPQFATFSNLKIKTVWGKSIDPVAATNNPSYYTDYNSALKRKEFSEVTPLQPGYWNTLSIVVSPAKQDEIGYFAMALDADTILLSTK